MENNNKESVYSSKVRAGKRRTYFFDVRQTKKDDYYITLTESTKRYEAEGYERHKIFLYKEDFNRFLANLVETIDYVKTELIPDFDYEQYERRQAEWESNLDEDGNPPANKEVNGNSMDNSSDTDEDMSW